MAKALRMRFSRIIFGCPQGRENAHFNSLHSKTKEAPSLKEKHMNIAISTVLLCIDAVFLYSAYTARKYANAIVGPYDFTKYIGLIMAALCVIVIAQSLASHTKDEKVSIPNFDLALLAVAATAVLLILWNCFGMFYLWGGIYVFVLFVALCSRISKLTKKSFLTLAVLTLIFMAVIYLLFNVLMGINL